MTHPRGHIEAPARYRRIARAKARRIGRNLVLEALEPRTLLTGPRITAITPTQVINGTFNHVDLTFDTPIDPTTFTTDDASLTGPPGVGTVPINNVVEQDSTHFEVRFAALTTRGTYHLAVGPNIADTQGNLMDQNQDGTGGEPNDVLTSSLTDIQATTVFTSATTISETNTTYDGQDIAIVGATVTINGTHSFNSVQLANGAVVTHSADTATQTHRLDFTVAEQVIVDASSRIDVTGKGYLPGYTTGNTQQGGATADASGSHGGLGTPGGTNAVYDDYADPDDWGAGGAVGGGSNPGGGLVRIAAATVTLDGVVTADGDGAIDSGRGGGAGGGIRIDAGTLSGTGSIRAAGGASKVAGGGGGGRVAVYAVDFTGFDTTHITAPGGHTGSHSTSYPDGGPGSVYLRDPDEPRGILLIDVGSGGSGKTPLGLPGQDTASIPDSLVIRGGAQVLTEHPGMNIHLGGSLTISGQSRLEGPVALTVGDAVTIDSSTLVVNNLSAPATALSHNSLLTCPDSTASYMSKLELMIGGSLTVDASSRIDVTGKGYLPGYTTGNTQQGGATADAGGSHGGLGTPGGTNAVYDDYADPDDWGAGGAVGGGSNPGGGLVRIAAATMTLDGVVTADGDGAIDSGRGGGAGGGIRIDAGTLSGTGSIRAAGGASKVAGGGGGGRVAVYAVDFTGFDTTHITAPGGHSTAYPDGGSGSVYLIQGLAHSHVKSYEPKGTNGGYLNGPIDHVFIKFSTPIKVSAQNAANIVVDGQMGHLVASGITLVGDRTYQVDFPTLTQNGPYHFTVLSSLLDINGNQLDQNINEIPGEPGDSYTFTLIVDTIPPRATNHDPAGDVAGTIDHIDVWFSETIDTTTFTTADVTVVKPDGSTVAATGIQNVGLNRFRISFPPQTLVGVYDVKVGPNVADLAGNLLDQNQNGIPGEAGDVYDATFNLAQVNLGLNSVQVQPGQLWAGEPATVSWSGQNLTGTPLLGNWVDAVYLSTDDQWDIHDILLATVPHTGGLAEGQTYTGSANVMIPGVLPGNYHMLVRADVANQEKEGPDHASNLADSGPIQVDVRALATDGSTAQGTLSSADTSDYYQVHLDGGQSLGLMLNGLTSPGVNELYVSLGAVPSRQNYDFRAIGDDSRTDNQNQTLALTAPADGATYYVLVYGSQNNGTMPYTLSGATGPFIVTSMTPTRGSNRAQTQLGGPIPHTVALSGAGFDDTMTVEFTAADGTVYDPTQINVASPSTMILDLDLPSWPAGSYAVTVAKGSTSVTLPQHFTAVEGGMPKLETDLVVPSALGFRIPIRQTLWIEYKNSGDAAMPAPLLQLHGDHGVRLTIDPNKAVPTPGFGTLPGTSDTIEVIGLGSSATPWILQPGESDRIPVYYVGLSEPAHYPRITFSLGVLTADDERSIDWASQEGNVRPPGYNDADWTLLFQLIRNEVGNTWGGYVAALSQSSQQLLSTEAADQRGTSALARTLTVQSTWSNFINNIGDLLGVFPEITKLGPGDDPALPFVPLCCDDQSLVDEYNQLQSEWSMLNDKANSLDQTYDNLRQSESNFLTNGISILVQNLATVRGLVTEIGGYAELAEKAEEIRARKKITLTHNARCAILPA